VHVGLLPLTWLVLSRSYQQVIEFSSGNGEPCAAPNAIQRVQQCTVTPPDSCSVQTECNNGEKDASESDVDCGGSSLCSRCSEGMKCAVSSDCGPSMGCGVAKTCVSECCVCGATVCHASPLPATVLLLPAEITVQSQSSFYVLGRVLVVGVNRDQLLQPDSSAQFKKGVSDHVNFVTNGVNNTVKSSDVGIVRFEETSIGSSSSCSVTVRFWKVVFA
jgi:hypothetical protein